MSDAAFADDSALVAALRAGDESAFAYLVDRHDAMLRRVARNYVSTEAVAAEVVQDTWLGVIEGIDRFEGRAALRTWIVRILMNQARSRGVREARSVPFSSVGPTDDGDLGGFNPDRFLRSGRDAGAWGSPPDDWRSQPAERLVSSETRDVVTEAISELTPQQREVITLRDVEGWSSAEVCDALDLSEVNQRVLLHRARGKVRAALDSYLGAVS